MTGSYTGAQALVLGALDSGVSLVTGVPGYPITGIMGLLLDSDVEARWSVNEKVALEAALGASAVGRRAVVTVKHVGMNILSDPLITSVTHTIGAGVVIVAGDDPGARQSQNEQDSRYYGLLAEVPVFDPPNPDVMYTCMRKAFRLSERVKTPVIVRVTDRSNSSTGSVRRSPVDNGEFPTFNRSTWSYTLKGKHQRFHLESYPVMVEASMHSDLTVSKERGDRIGIISSGYLSEVAEKVISDRYRDISHLALCLVNPLPASMVEHFIRQHDRILVTEETEPVIEQQMSCSGILGKRTGHLPYGKLEAGNIIWALEHIGEDQISPEYDPETHKSRGFSMSICEDCPYHVLYRALDTLGGLVAGDLGCSVRTAPPPMEVVDMAYSLGSSIAVATGFSDKGIALIGDFGLLHTGLQGLIEAVTNEKDVLVVVLQNKVAALTGGQNVPDLTHVIQSLVPGTIILDMEQTGDDELVEILKAGMSEKGVSVVLARGECRKY